MSKYVRTDKMAELWGVSRRSVNMWCKAGLIDGAKMDGNRWMVPLDAIKPEKKKSGKREMSAAGIQDFGVLRQQKAFYVDKSYFISKWWEAGDQVTLITRPRRFGKTLNLSMLEYYFSNIYEGNSLFDGLAVEEWRGASSVKNAYPVVFISFAGIKADNYYASQLQLVELLYKLYSRFIDIINDELIINTFDRFSRCLSSGEVDEKIEVDIAMSINRLAGALNQYYGKKVIILLDEYDTPLQEAYAMNYWTETTSLFRNFFNNTFKSNPYLERGMITGITRISKESIFSDLNNLVVITSATPLYEDCFGFTEKELIEVLKRENLLEELHSIREWYDGFTFGECKGIYNPWSIQNYLKFSEYGCYWSNTSSNGLVSMLMKKSTSEVKKSFEKLLQGNEIQCVLDEQISFDQLERRTDALWSFLLAAGYLKINKKILLENGNYSYDLSITNKEVMVMMKNLVHEWFVDDYENYNGFIQALLEENEEYMNEYLSRVALNCFSSFDGGTNESEHTSPERFYHGFILGLLVDLENDYLLKSNHESGLGRYDIMLIPRKSGKKACIFEFKVKSKAEKNLSETVERALQQIKDKKYTEILAEVGIEEENICNIGIGFSGKKVLVRMH